MGPPPPALGSDPNPAALTGAAAVAYASRDNAITFQLTEAGPQPLHLAVAVAYAGTGTPGAAALALYLWDPAQTQSWFVVAPVTLPIGEVTQVDVPVVMSALAQAWTVSVVLSVASPAAGIYAVALGLSESATTSSGGGGAGDATAANQLLQLSQETATAASTAATASSSATTAAETTATAASAAAIAAAVTTGPPAAATMQITAPGGVGVRDAGLGGTLALEEYDDGDRRERCDHGDRDDGDRRQHGRHGDQRGDDRDRDDVESRGPQRPPPRAPPPPPPPWVRPARPLPAMLSKSPGWTAAATREPC